MTTIWNAMGLSCLYITLTITKQVWIRYVHAPYDLLKTVAALSTQASRGYKICNWKRIRFLFILIERSFDCVKFSLGYGKLKSLIHHFYYFLSNIRWFIDLHTRHCPFTINPYFCKIYIVPWTLTHMATIWL